MAKNDPFIHKPYTLCVLCVLRGKFLQCTHLYFCSYSFGPILEIVQVSV